MAILRESFETTSSELTEKTNDPIKYNESLKKLCTLKDSKNLSFILRHMKSFVNSQPFNVNIFKKGVSASWEDPKNLAGCSWSIQCKPEYSNALFERISIYFCFHGFDHFNCNGISANIRRNFVKFTVWSENIPSVVDGSEVLEELKDAFGFENAIEFIYKNHKDLVEKVVGAQ